MSFAPEYVRHVLTDNFEDAKRLFLDPLLSIHSAHLVMLTERGIVSEDDAHLLRKALDGISPDEVRRAAYDGGCEDMFFYVERLITRACVEEVGGRLHTARSRRGTQMFVYPLY